MGADPAVSEVRKEQIIGEEPVEQGALRPVVDAVVDPEAIAETHRRLETRHGIGKVVLSGWRTSNRSCDRHPWV